MWHQRLAFQQLNAVPAPPTRLIPVEKTRNVNMPTQAHGVVLADQTAVNADLVTEDIIVSQCPPRAAMYDFWRMVIQNRVSTIICLAQPEDHGGFRAYFPDTANDIRTFGELEIMTCTKTKIGDIVFRTIGVVNTISGDMLFLNHAHAPWPDGCPPPNERVAADLLDILQHDHQHRKVVHCAAGVGRACTLVAMHLLCLNPHAEPYDVVSVLRSRRVGAVHTMQQFSYLYEFKHRVHNVKRNEVSSVPLVAERRGGTGQDNQDTLVEGNGNVLYLQDVHGTETKMPISDHI